MHAKLRGWLITICVLTVVGALIVTDPVTLRGRTVPQSNRPLHALARVWKFYIYPPVPNVRLGLDLQGGSHIVLRARNQAVLTYTFGRNLAATEDQEGAVQAQIRELLVKQGIANPSVTVSRREATVRTDAENQDEAAALGKRVQGVLEAQYGKDFGPLSAAEPKTVTLSGGRLNDVMRILSNRVNAFGLSETVLQPQQPDRIIVEMPGTEDPRDVLDRLQQTAVLEFVHVPRKYSPEAERDPETGHETTRFTDRSGKEIPTAQVLAEARVVVRGDQLKPNSKVIFDPTNRLPEVAFEFNAEGGVLFHEFTRSHLQQFLAIVLDGTVISAPRVEAAISTSGVIRGGFASQREAKDLADLLNAGALPVPLEVAESRIVSPTLGKDSLIRSLWAGLAGFILVMLFMAWYYRLPGLLANLALIIYCILVLALLKLFNATLTLPGIAGIILSIGMAVDANVIIFERLKEELHAEKTLKSAIEAGFKRAWTAILDSNVCSIGTALVLVALPVAPAPVKGFAITLLIGVATSLFTAVTVTRLFMYLAANTRAARNLSWFGI